MGNNIFVQEFDLPEFVMVGSIHRESDDELVKYVPERTCTFDFDVLVDAYVCSVCDCFEYEPDVLNFNFCPNCGAKVVKE